LPGALLGVSGPTRTPNYCLLSGVLPEKLDADRTTQALSSFAQIEALLHTMSMDFSHVVRTWFFLDHLLDWYDEFNVARTNFFRSRGIFDHIVPASTGIGGANPSGSALAASAFAMRPRHDRDQLREVESPCL
jgi:enamine deaminase RidA (YjgF/YER057c/UK114 family)